MMIRKQIYLSENDDRRLKRLARSRRVSEAEIIRGALRRVVDPAAAKDADALDRVIGSIDIDLEDGALNHDVYIYDDPHNLR